jgi:xanthine dehydrogenase accessory factor
MLQTPRPITALPQRATQSDRPEQILTLAADWYDDGYATAIIMLVEIRGGAARDIGSVMAVRHDGLYAGYVSGGCTEGSIAAEALLAIRNGRDRILKVGAGSAFFDVTLPCGGGLTLAIHVLSGSAVLRTMMTELAARRRGVIEYHPQASCLTIGCPVRPTGWHDDRFQIACRPTPRIVIFGSSAESTMTAHLGQAAGYDMVEVSSARHLTNDDAIDIDTAVAILHHDLDDDLEAIERVLRLNPFYIGALGSQRTHEKRSAALAALGFSPAEIARIKAPIGIFPKARDAASIALSVLADIAYARQAGL